MCQEIFEGRFGKFLVGRNATLTLQCIISNEIPNIAYIVRVDSTGIKRKEIMEIGFKAYLNKFPGKNP